MTTTNTFTGRTARNAIENPPINKQDCFEAGFNEFEEEFIGGLERGEKELGSGGGPAVDSNAEMAMKVALEMTGAAEAESGDDTTAASDLLLDLSGRTSGMGASSSTVHLNPTSSLHLFPLAHEDLHLHKPNATTSNNSRRPPRKQQSQARKAYQDDDYLDIQAEEEGHLYEDTDGVDNAENDFAATANRIKIAANLVRSKKEKSGNKPNIKDEDLYLDGAPDDPSSPNGVAPFVTVGRELDRFYYKNKNCKTQKEFLNWTKRMLGFSKSTTYEYIISYRVYSDIKQSILPNYPLPQYQSHCQLLSKIPSEDLAAVWMKICDLNENQMTTSILEDFLKKNQYMDKKPAASSRSRKRGAGGSSSGSGAGMARASSSATTTGPASSAPLKKKKKKRRRNDDDDTEDDAISSDHFSDEEYFNLVVPVKKQVSPQQHSHVGLLSDSLQDLQAIIPTPPKIQRSASSSRSLLPLAQQEAAIKTVGETDQFASHRLGESHVSYAIPALPFDISHVFDVGQRVVHGGVFDNVCHTIAEFEELEGDSHGGCASTHGHATGPGWSGRVFCNLTAARPYASLGGGAASAPGIERLLQIIFTRYANNEYSEGIFVIRAEFGADWFTPILQHPCCVLRQHRYLGGGGSGAPAADAAFDCYVAFYMGPNVTSFCNHYRNVGYLPGFNCWSYAPNPISSASRSSLGIRSSLGGNDSQEPLNVSSAAIASTSTFPKDFMLNDHHSVGSAVVSVPTATGGAHLGSSGLDHLGVGGLEMPMEDLAASILSHLSQ